MLRGEGFELQCTGRFIVLFIVVYRQKGTYIYDTYTKQGQG